MTWQFTVSAVIPTDPQTIYDAWLDSDGHTRMTGSSAHASPDVGGRFDAFDGHIRGTNLELDRGRRIVQSWRAEDYAASDGDSRIEVTLEPVAEGTLLTLVHSNVPDDQTGHQEGWRTHYFLPMAEYFAAKK